VQTTNQEGRTAMGYLVRTITALQLQLGDVVIPDTGPRRHVTLHRLQGAHPVVAVQFAEIPGATNYYPPTMPLLIEIPDAATSLPAGWSL
jgi:hypothetical protein